MQGLGELLRQKGQSDLTDGNQPNGKVTPGSLQVKNWSWVRYLVLTSDPGLG